MSEQSIAALFEHLVELNPDREAVNHGGESLTFETLNRAANRVARAIVGQRGEREEAVALLYGKTTAVISALLGTLKAGKFYVALDASDPPGRSTLILQDAQAGLLLCDREHLVKAQTIAPSGCVVMDVESMARERDDSNLGLDIAGDRLVSLTYTSGSTGTPKGTARTQQSVMIMVQGRGERGLNRPGDRQAMLYSLSVASMETIVFSAVLNDGTCSVYDIQKEGSGGIAAWLQREKVSLYQSTPTVFRHFIAQ